MVTPWHASARTRVALVVGALLLLAAGAALLRGDGETDASAVAVSDASGATPPGDPPGGQASSADGGTGGDASGGETGGESETEAGTDTGQPQPLLVDLRPAAVGQGETMLVWVSAPGAASALLDVRGERYTLIAEQRGVFWGLVGLPLDAALGADTLTVTARDAAGAVLDTAQTAYTVTTVDRPVDELELTDEQSAVLTPEAGAHELRLRTQQFAEFDRGRRWTGRIAQPLDAPITTFFGQGRSYNGGPVGGFHTGTDFGAAEGTTVRAAAPARVAWTGEMPIRGQSVILDHGAGVKTGYHHLSAITVAVGQEIAAGEIVGQVGSTGLSTGPHLHWELTIWGVNVDPMTWTLRDFTP